MLTQSFGLSDIGRTRTQNEDSFLVSPSLELYVVSDGLGGHASGEVASQLAVKTVEEYVTERKSLIERSRETPGGHFKLIEVVERAVQEACRRIYELASTDKEHAGMATTLTLLLVVDDKAIMAHVGDSRLYIIRNGKVHLISNDHTLINELAQKGSTIDPSRAAASPMAHVLTRSVGNQQSVSVDTLLFDLVPGDVCLLCTDGLTQYLTDPGEILEILAPDDLERTGTRLVKLANDRGGKDNITLILVALCRDESEGQAELQRAQEIQLKLATLGNSGLLKGLSFNLLTRILNNSIIRHCEASERVIGRGDVADGLFVVLDGRLNVRKGNELVSELRRADTFGELALIRSWRARVTIEAEEPSTILFFPRDHFTKMAQRLPRLGCKLLRRIAEHAWQALDETLSEDGLEGAHKRTWF